MKLRKEWIPVWLAQTHTFRPTTKMPQFRLQQDEIQAIAAFIWQHGNYRTRLCRSSSRAMRRTASS